jgi:dTDP-4-amino-4,6-dideoxygalactose transaminase
MIPMNDFKAEPSELQAEELAAANRVIQSGWYILGKEVEAFEKSFAEFCGARSCAGVGNGMDAIEIGLRALNIGAGDEVVTTPMTAFATVLAVLRAGATPVLADIDLASGLLDLQSVERCLSKKTKALLLVHLFGQMRETQRWADFCAGQKVYFLEDCAQSHGAAWNGKAAGTIGAWGAFSFYPTKNLGALGDGGALVTNQDEIFSKAKMLRNYGQSDRYHHPVLGMNSRLDEMHAAILSVRLKWLRQFTARRREIAAAFRTQIQNRAITHLAAPLHEENHVHHLFVIRCKERERLAGFLNDRGVKTLVHYPIPVHKQPPCQNIRIDAKGLNEAEKFAAECLSLPCHPQMSSRDVQTVIESVNAFA